MGPVAGVQLGEQRRHVGLDGTHRDVQPLGDLGVRQALAQQPQHVRLSSGDARFSELVGDGTLGSAPARHGSPGVAKQPA